MAPQPNKDIEVDMERKEELILAKQLRACRVSILPRLPLQSYGFKAPSPPPPVPVKKNHLQAPQPKKEHVDKASSPIALRYWQQCMQGSDLSVQQTVDTSSGSSNTGYDRETTTTISSTVNQHNTTILFQQQQERGARQEKQKPSISVPDIRRHMKEVKTNTNWEEILQEEDNPPPSFYRKISSPSQFNPVHFNSCNTRYLEVNRDHDDPSPVTERRQINHLHPYTRHGEGQSRKTFSISLSEIKVPSSGSVVERKVKLGDGVGGGGWGEAGGRGELPLVAQQQEQIPRTEIVRVLSTAGQGIKREKEVAEARGNIGRFITIGQLKTGPIDKNTTKLTEPSTTKLTPPTTAKLTHTCTAKLTPPTTVHLDSQANPESKDNLAGSNHTKPSGEKNWQFGFANADSNGVSSNNPEANDAKKEPVTVEEVQDEKYISNTSCQDNPVENLSFREMNEWCRNLIGRLDQVQINSLGLHLYTKLSQQLVEEIIVQQMQSLSNSTLTLLQDSLSVQACDSLVEFLYPRTSPRLKAQLAGNRDGSAQTTVENLKQELLRLDPSTRKKLWSEIKESRNPSSLAAHSNNIGVPSIVVSPDITQSDPEDNNPGSDEALLEELEDERSMAESFLSARSEAADEKNLPLVGQNPEKDSLDDTLEDQEDLLEADSSLGATDSEGPGKRSEEEQPEKHSEIEEQEEEEEEEEWEEGEAWEENEEEYLVETFNGSFSVSV